MHLAIAWDIINHGGLELMGIKIQGMMFMQKSRCILGGGGGGDMTDGSDH